MSSTSIQTSVRGGRRGRAAGATLAILLAGVVVLAPPHEGAGAVGAVPTVTIQGPDQVTLLDTVQLFADTTEVTGDVRIAWDLDGDGEYETTDDGDHTVSVPVRRLGTHDYSVQVTTGAGALIDDHEVQVVAPVTSRLALSPALPRQGQQVTLGAGARGSAPVATVWDIEGIKPRRTSTPIGRTSARRALVANATTLGSRLDVSGTGQDVTAGTRLTATIPKTDAFEDRTLTLRSQSVFGDGTRMTTVRNVQVTASKAAGYATKTIPADTVFSCDDLPTNGPASPCASLTYSNAKSTYPTLFDDTTPSISWCHPVGETPTPNNTTVKEQAQSIAGSPDFWGSLTQARARKQPTPATSVVRRAGEACLLASPQTVRWDFGDSTGAQFPTSDAPVPHTYAEPGTYTVTLVTKVPYLKSVDGVLSSSPRWMTVQRTAKVKVTQGDFCGALDGVGGLRLYTQPVGTKPHLWDAAWFPEGSCWDVLVATDGHPVYRTRPGWVVWAVSTSPTSEDARRHEQVRLIGKLAGSVRKLLVDPTTDTITPLQGAVEAVWGPQGQPERRALATPVLKVPSAGSDGRHVFPAMPGGAALNGLTVTSQQLVVRDGAAPYVKVSLDLPKPMTGDTPVAYVADDPTTIPEAVAGGAGDQRRAGFPPGVDFRLDLSGQSIAGIGIEEGWLEHHTDGDIWKASLVVDFGGSGLSAPYVADGGAGQPESCTAVAGPSGLQIKDGSFDFAGASFRVAPPAVGPSVGPLSISCVAANLKTSPFLFRGAVEGRLVNTPVGFNACFAFGILVKDQEPGQCNSRFRSPEEGLFWMRIAGKIGLLDYYTLQGSVEGAFGSGTNQLIAEGKVVWEVRTSPVDVLVEYGLRGAIRFNTGEFSLMGHVGGCINPAYIPTICADVAQGGITSRGGGVCVGPAGAVYLVNGGFDWFLISCDLKRDIAIPNLRARAAGINLEVKPGLGKVTVVARGEPGRSPDVTLRAPGGRLIVAGEQRGTKGLRVVHNDRRGETYVWMADPPAGTWRVTKNADSAPLEAVDLYVPAGTPRITGEVTGRGATRQVGFDTKNLLPADRILFYEKSGTSQRFLGVRDRADSGLGIPASGRPGDRTVVAVLERRGIPFAQFPIDTYRAPGLPDLTPVTAVTATAAGQALTTTWKAVPGAKKYRVTLVLADGRVLRTTTTRLTTTFPEVTRLTGGKVAVVALNGYARDSDPRADALTPIRTITLRL